MTAERPALLDARNWLVCETTCREVGRAALALDQALQHNGLFWPTTALPVVFLLALAGATLFRESLRRSAPGCLLRVPATVFVSCWCDLDHLVLMPQFLVTEPMGLVLQGLVVSVRQRVFRLCPQLDSTSRFCGLMRRKQRAAVVLTPQVSGYWPAGAKLWRPLSRVLVRRMPTIEAPTTCHAPVAPPRFAALRTLPFVTGTGAFILLGPEGAASVLAPGACGIYEVTACERGLRALAVRGLAVQARVPLVEHARLAGRIAQLRPPVPLPADCALLVQQMAQWLRGAAALPAQRQEGGTHV